jgi:hypothetical protein
MTYLPLFDHGRSGKDLSSWHSAYWIFSLLITLASMAGEVAFLTEGLADLITARIFHRCCAERPNAD